MFRAPGLRKTLCKTYVYAYLDTLYPLSIMNKAYSCAYCTPTETLDASTSYARLGPKVNSGQERCHISDIFVGSRPLLAREHPG